MLCVCERGRERERGGKKRGRGEGGSGKERENMNEMGAGQNFSKHGLGVAPRWVGGLPQAGVKEAEQRA